MIKNVDIVVPVFNEAESVIPFLKGLADHVESSFRVLICYDQETDTTLEALDQCSDPAVGKITVERVKNRGRGPHSAVTTGMARATAPCILVMPVDDVFNADIIDEMVALVRQGYEIVCASRFMPGGTLQGCPWLKETLVRLAAFTLHKFAGIPTRDATSGFRMFARSLLLEIPIESKFGFTYSLELLVKCHRKGGRIAEIPAKWIEREHGESRFRVGRWLFAYLRWYFFAFATSWGSMFSNSYGKQK